MDNSGDRQNPNANAGDGGSRRQAFRGEGEWRGLLRRAENETARFFDFYEKTFGIPEGSLDEDRLDHCALAMGWHLGAPDNDAETPAGGDDPADGNADAEQPSQEFSPVYSLHNLPESIAVSAVFKFAENRWGKLLQTNCAEKLSARAAGILAGTLSAAHRDMLLAIDAEEAMEFGLSVCLMKNAHAALNRHFAGMKMLAPTNARERKLARELRCAVMDLRDLCLRILRASREELEKSGGEK